MSYIWETADCADIEILRDNSRQNRQNHTEAEKMLWEHLRRRSTERKFRRQHVIGDFIVDFVCLHNKLIVEVDGKYHYVREKMIEDEERTRILNQKGFTVIRFSNEEVLGNISSVINKIKNKMSELEHTNNNIPIQSPPLSGRPGGAALAWAVDAGCSGNPGPMEYQCVDLQTGTQVFHFGPIRGTNNIGEFLAIVHALALMEQKGITDRVIYSDSVNAQLWVRKMQCKTKLEQTPETAKALELVRRAETWLRTHSFRVPIIKWDTKNWGEIPADFGRK